MGTTSVRWCEFTEECGRLGGSLGPHFHVRTNGTASGGQHAAKCSG